MVDITPSAFKILEYIGRYGTSTGYDLSKKKDPFPVVSDKTAYTLLPNLVENGFLSVTSTKKNKMGRYKKEYSLTVLGVSELLSRCALPHCLEPIIEHWSNVIPRVLGVWNLLQHVDEDVLRSVIGFAAFEIAILPQISGPDDFTLIPEQYSKTDDDIFTFKFYWELLSKNVDSGRFLREIEDLNLRDLLKDILESSINVYESYINVYKKQIEIFETDLQILNQ